LGYSGVNSSLKTKNGITGEIQVNSPEMIYAKETPKNARAILGDDVYDSISAKTGIEGGLGHKLYEQWRALPEGSPGRLPLEAQSKAYYDAIRSKAGQSAPHKITYVDLPNDLVANSNGVYGYLPTVDSQFHSSRWPVDWTNREQVAGARSTRLDYHAELNKKREFVDSLRRDGIDDNVIAKKIVDMRNQDRLSHDKTAESLEVVYKRNLNTYGNKFGPTYESQLQKYGSAAEVINAALRSNNTMDILTGLAKPK
jgi:hypothetical protein